jgi:ring-1,2-phenylacetyl-CoA epoxidase subunit PaaC
MLHNPLDSYLLHLADNALILGHRNSEWCGHGPVLEQDIALTNICLDLIGQARYLYQYAAERKGGDTTEDSLAYLRDSREYLNLLICELPKGDWGFTIMRQYFVSAYQLKLYQSLQRSEDHRLAAIAAKAVKESAYHHTWSSEWVIRLGDGTAESHDRMQRALDELWPYTGELFDPADYEGELTVRRVAPDPADLKDSWMQDVQAVLEEATLKVPESTWHHRGGKSGVHTEHLGFILADMQFLQRAYPGNEW